MNRVDLTALRADVPMGAMAAFGCLRICARKFTGSKLSWERAGGSFNAVLWTVQEIPRDQMVTALIADAASAATRPEFNWGEQIKTATLDKFQSRASEAVNNGTAADHDEADWFAAFGSELVTKDGKIEPSPFDMSVARQRFLADGVKLGASLTDAGKVRKSVHESFAEALFGPWKYEDDQHSLGWDPSTVKLGAFTFRAPTEMSNAGVRAAVWLAFESLPLFPCFYSHGLVTRAFGRRGKELALFWPVWQPPISLAALKSLLASPALVGDDRRSDELQARGVMAIYRSAQFKPNKYLFSFRTPELVLGSAASAAG